MDAQKTLKDFKEKIDPEIEKYLSRIIKETEKVDENVADALRHVRKIILSGGKRARAALMFYGYLAAGGKNFKEMLKTSVSIELIHIFLLIHDDIIDEDIFRHGVVTIHTHYEKIGRKFLKNKNPEHFGNSMGIIVGDMMAALGNQVLFESNFSPKLIIEALIKLQKIVSLTIVGETEDIYIENMGRANEEEIMRMYENKTAKYTIEGPLHLGAILAGADQKFLDALSAYAIPIGIAFQIQDDILGVFGMERKTGKSVGADVRQGKQTILVAKAYEKADKSQKKILDTTLGKKDLAANDLENFRRVIIETGSLSYAENLAKDLIKKGKKAMVNSNLRISIKKDAADFLLGVADYIIQRTV